ncbi:hypothetical protein D3C77_775670 [compost metagenome]
MPVFVGELQQGTAEFAALQPVPQVLPDSLDRDKLAHWVLAVVWDVEDARVALVRRIRPDKQDFVQWGIEQA